MLDSVVDKRRSLNFKRVKGLFTAPLLRLAMRDGSHTIDQDVPIWENKVFWERPHLCSNDGPIMRFRKWAQQFYSAGATERSDALDAMPGYEEQVSDASQDHSYFPAQNSRSL